MKPATAHQVIHSTPNFLSIPSERDVLRVERDNCELTHTVADMDDLSACSLLLRHQGSGPSRQGHDAIEDWQRRRGQFQLLLGTGDNDIGVAVRREQIILPGSLMAFPGVAAEAR
jgi:hypothetical protein